MNKYFSYYRVSSQDQAENGVSLGAQKEANTNYAKENGWEIVKEFEEVQSAAKKGRKQFTLMLKEINRRKDINGIIFHDVDRSARSISDWSKIKELSNKGLHICFSRDKSDLSTRGNSLTNTIKAVIAEDFIANLSQETKKGMYRKAELGYTVFGHIVPGYIKKEGGENGLRIPDPHTAPLVKRCFELYATDKYTLEELADEMFKRGLRARSGKRLEYTKISRILNDTYYIGIIKMNGKTFAGIHQPLVSVKLFNQVQVCLRRRYTPHTRRNKYIFSHLFTCAICGKPIRSVTSKHKYQYYWCRDPKCEMRKAVGENKVEDWIKEQIKNIQFTSQEIKQMLKVAQELRQSFTLELAEKENGLKLQIDNVASRLNQLTDLLLDNTITKETYNQKREQYILEKKTLESEINEFKDTKISSFDKFEELAQLIGNPIQAYELANHENKSNLIKKMMTNLQLHPNGIKFAWQTPFLALYKRKNELLNSSFPLGVPTGNRTQASGTTTRRSTIKP